MPTWDSSQYLKFANERTQPAIDLAAHVALEAPTRVIDLGCGPGNSTAVLARRWPKARLAGLDSSTEMIATARQQNPQWTWWTGDITNWSKSTIETFDVVFSSAALQWVPNHTQLLPALLVRVAPGGAFAMQVPGNLEAPAHRIMSDLVSSASWATFFREPVREWWVEEISFYYDLLASHAVQLALWTTDYLHVLPNAEAIVEWYKGTGLRPFIDMLSDPADQKRFLADYLHEIKRAYPAHTDGRVLFPFRRFFLVAYR